MQRFNFVDQGAANASINIAVGKLSNGRYVFDSGVKRPDSTYRGYASDISESDVVELVNGLLAELGVEQQVQITTETVTTKKVELV